MSSPIDPAELTRRLQGLNLYLVGMMGAGKSAVGRPLADALGYRYLDADQVLEQAAGCSIPAIFDRITGWHSLVVATGGGVVTRPVNWGHLRQGVVIWLDASPNLLLERLQADPTPRPLLATEDPAARLETLLQARRPLYAQADLRVEQLGGDAPQTVAQRVLEALPTILKDRPQAPAAPAQLQDGDGRLTQSLN